MSFKIDNSNESFCLAPWLHSYLDPTGRRSFCCIFDGHVGEIQSNIDDIWNSEEYKNIRIKMLNGEEIKGCHRCPLNTKQLTYRDYWNTFFSNYLEHVLENTSENGNYNPLPVSIDYRTSKCNFKCKMCSSKFSSAIYKEEIKQKGVNIDLEVRKQYDESFIEMQNQLIIKDVELLSTHLQEMSWAGGEPLINDYHWKSIEYLIESKYAKNVHLRYTTNLSNLYYKNYDLTKIIPYFKKVDIYASIDATHEIGEWIRSGFKYDKFISNLNKLKQINHKNLNIFLMVSCGISTLIDLPNLNKLASDFDLNIQIQDVVGTTDLLMIKSWPYNIVSPLLEKTKKIIKKQQTNNTSTILNFLNDEYKKENFKDRRVEKLRESYEEILYLDRLRPHKSIKFHDIISKNTDLVDFYDNVILQ